MFKIGVINGYGGKPVRIDERYFIGINEIRGFDYNGIGPRDARTGDALGGNYYGLLKFQIEHALPFLKMLDPKISVFCDNANLQKLDPLTKGPPLSIIANNSLIRSSVGAGVSWNTPFGAMRLDYGIVLHSDKADIKKKFRFIVGGEF